MQSFLKLNRFYTCFVNHIRLQSTDASMLAMAKREQLPDDLISSESRQKIFLDILARAKLPPRISFIGGGNMAQALGNGLVKSGLVETENIVMSDPEESARNNVKKLGFTCFKSNRDVLDFCFGGVVVLAVKPNSLADVLQQHADDLSSKCGLIISLLAGVKTSVISNELAALTSTAADQIPPVVRVMPNTPALVGFGATALCRGPNCLSLHADLTKFLFQTVGICHEVSENLMDAVCGLSGSGPAYIFTIIEALSDGGVLMGLSRQLSTSLAASTVLGAAQMVLQNTTNHSGKHTGQLRDMVTSPGGTTIAGIYALEEHNIRAAFMKAVEVATKRSQALGEMLEKGAKN